MILKFCLGCGKWLPVGDYYPRADRQDGIYPRCIACTKAKAIWSPLRKRAAVGAKSHYSQDRNADSAVCRQCKERKPMTAFNGRDWLCYDCRRKHWQRDNERRRRLRKSAPTIVVDVDLPAGHYDDLLMAGGIILRRTQHQCAIPGARLYVDIWQGTDEAGQLYQGWTWAMYYD